MECWTGTSDMKLKINKNIFKIKKIIIINLAGMAEYSVSCDSTVILLNVWKQQQSFSFKKQS